LLAAPAWPEDREAGHEILELTIVTVTEIFLGAGGVSILVGLWMVASHFAHRPPRYDRPRRFDAEGPPRRQIGRLPAGLVLICAGPVMFLISALAVQSN
jgi:hypothetical protein